MPKVRWIMSHGFCSKLYTVHFAAVDKFLKVKDLTKLQRV